MGSDNPYDNMLTIPARPDGSMTGSQLASSIIEMDLGPERELAIFQQFELGNIPNFLRTLLPITRTVIDVAGGKKECTYWVTSDVLAIGTDNDFMRVPMNPLTATKIADLYGASLITRQVSRDIHANATIKLDPLNEKLPLTMPSGDPKIPMTGTRAFVEQNAKIETQRRAFRQPVGVLIAGHKKDIVLCKALEGAHDRVAIYGWHKPNGNPIQGLNAVSHNNRYADYSHGVRLVSDTILVNDDYMTFEEVIRTPALAGLISDEGALSISRYPGT